MFNTCILLDGSIKNDSRVKRIINSLTGKSKIYLFYINGTKEDQNLFDQNVELFTYPRSKSWLYDNFLFHKKYAFFYDEVIKQDVKFDFVYCNDYPLLDIAVKITNTLNGAKLIYDTHEIYIETINQFFPTEGIKSIYGKLLIALNKSYHYKRESKLIHYADHIITVCNSFKDYLEKEYHLHDVKVIMNCPNKGLEFNNQLNIKEKLNLKSTDVVLIYQGFYNKGRGLEKLIQASDYFNDNIYMAFIGGGSLKNELENLVLKKSKKNVFILGMMPYDELLSYTHSADAGLLFIQSFNRSKELTLPNKVFEYMAAGIPILSNNLPESSRIINTCQCGKCITNDDILHISQFINDSFSDKSEMQLLGKNGAEFYQNEYYWENQVQPLLDIIS